MDAAREAPKQATALSYSFSHLTSAAINLFRLYERFKIIPRSGVHLVKSKLVAI